MVLGGLWHGAAWTFVLWGTLHGVFLAINHAWRTIQNQIGIVGGARKITMVCSTFLTFLLVTVAWVVFRANSMSAACNVLSGMFGLNGFAIPTCGPRLAPEVSPGSLFSRSSANWTISLCLLGVWILPNVRQIFLRYKPTWEDVMGKVGPANLPSNPIGSRLVGKQLKLTHAWLIGALATCCFYMLNRVSEFLYFQF